MALVRRWSVPSWVRLASTITLSVYSAFVGVVLILDRQLKPSTWKWVHSTRVLVGLTAVLAALTFGDNVRRAVARHRSVAHLHNRIEIRNQMGSLVVTVARIHDIPAEDIGCGLFLRQGRWLRRPSSWLPPRGWKRPERLTRVERLRLPDNVPESRVEFTIGKGTVGHCWQHEKHAHSDWIAINRRYPTPESIEGRWSKIPERTTRGFTQKEFVSLAGKYTEVLAVPIMINGEFEGCIAIDRKWNKDDIAARSLFNDEATKVALGATAKTLVPSLKKG